MWRSMTCNATVHQIPTIAPSLCAETFPQVAARSKLLLSCKECRRILHTSVVQRTFKPSLVWVYIRKHGKLDLMFGIGTSIVGLGNLLFYQITDVPSRTEYHDESPSWPESVCKSIRWTYLYFTVGFGISGVIAYCIAGHRTFSVIPWCTASAIMTTATSIWCQSFPYEGFPVNLKHLMWLCHLSAVGCAIAPLALAGLPVVLRATSYICGGIVALFMAALYAEDEKLLRSGALSSLCLGGVLGATLCRILNPVPWKYQPPVGSLLLVYVTLIGIGAHMWYNVGKVIDHAEARFEDGRCYDPINNSLGIYMDLVHPRYCLPG